MGLCPYRNTRVLNAIREGKRAWWWSRFKEPPCCSYYYYYYYYYITRIFPFRRCPFGAACSCCVRHTLCVRVNPWSYVLLVKSFAHVTFNIRSVRSESLLVCAISQVLHIISGKRCLSRPTPARVPVFIFEIMRRFCTLSTSRSRLRAPQFRPV